MRRIVDSDGTSPGIPSLILGDRDERSGAGNHGAGDHRQDAVQFMAQPLPLPRVRDRPERGQQSCRCGRNIEVDIDLVEVELVEHTVDRG